MAKHKETLNTPDFRGAFMSVFEPKDLKQIDKETGKPKRGWQITMLFKDGETLRDIKDAASRVLEAEFGPKENGKWPKPRSDKNPNGYRVPWRDQSEKDKDNDDADKTYDGYKTGNLFMNATRYATTTKGSTNERPFVVDENVEDIIDKKLIYSGAYYTANIELYWYDNESKGIGIGFNGIMKVDDGEPLGGSSVTAASVFSPRKVNKKKAATAVFEDDEDDPLA